MEISKIKHSIRKIAELGVGAIAIATLALAGCGGGGGSLGGAGTFISVAALLGQFQTGTQINVIDASGVPATGVVDSTGKATVQLTGLHSPLLVSVLPAPNSNNTIYFYDEKLGPQSAVLPTGTAAIRALVPNGPAAGTTLSVGVTPLTEMAVGYLVQNHAITSSGSLAASATPALATAAANAVGSIFGMSASAVLSAPTIIGASNVQVTDLASPANQYALKLAALANMATTGNNALTVSQALTNSFQTGTFGQNLAASGVITGVTISTSTMTPAAITAAFSTAINQAAQTLVPSSVPTQTITTVANTVQVTTTNVNVQLTDYVGGTVSGLNGSVVLQDNGGDNLTISANGTFTFVKPVTNTGTYVATVLTQPSGQTCTVSSGSGTISGSNVTNVSVVCAINTYSVGGTVSGLTGSVVLQDNNGDNLNVASNGSFTFATKVASSSPYNVTVLTQPSGQNCTVTSGLGTIGNNVTNVAVACATSTATTQATQIANAKTLLASLRTNVNLLGNSGQTGFIQNQASAVQADLTTSQNTFSESKDFLKFATNAVGLLRNGNVTSTPTVTTIYANGQPWPCGAIATSGSIGEAVCQWEKVNTAGTEISTHQLVITGPISSAATSSPSTLTGTYSWTDTIIGTSNGSSYSYYSGTVNRQNGTKTSGIGNLGAVITLGSPITGTTDQNGVVLSPYYTTTSDGVTGTGTMTISAASGVALSFDSNGNLSAGTTANVSLVGNTLAAVTAAPATSISTYDGLVPLNSAGYPLIDHVNINFTGSIAATAVAAGTQDTINLSGSIARWSIPTPANIGGVSVNSITIGSGSNAVEIVGTSTTKGSPVSINLLGMTATTPNYSFNGTLAMSSFAQDANTMCTQGWNQSGICQGSVSSPNWYPQKVSFTGSIGGINTNASLGNFITTTGTGLVVNLNETPTTGYLGYNPNNPQSSTNYQIGSATFSGSIVNGSLTYQISNLMASSGNTVTAYNPVGTLSLTYTDPSDNVVSVNGTGSGSTGTVSASLTSPTVTTPVTITGTTSASSGTVYSGSLAAVNAGTATQIGTISNGLVYFFDNTNQSLQ